MTATAELSAKGNRIIIRFPYEVGKKDQVKEAGGTFVPAHKGGPYWQMPLDLTAGRRLREIFGPDLHLSSEVIAWGKKALSKERNLHSLASGDDVPIEDLLMAPKLPALAEFLRPYQRADVKFLGTTSALNMNEQRLGKTVEMIAAVYESNLELGHHLFCAPQKSLDSVWRMEWERWTDMQVFTYSGETSKRDRLLYIDAMVEMYGSGEPFVLVTTADMIRRGLPMDIDTEFSWETFTIDEFHKTGLTEAKNKFPKKCGKIDAFRRWGMSGTPMGGKPIKMWGALHFLDPDSFTSKWRWAGQWLKIETDERGYKSIGGVQPGREEEFYKALSPYAIRRLRQEVLPQLPAKQSIDVWCKMTEAQRKQYKTFEKAAEIRIDDYHLSATSVLAEYTRLKQFANAVCEVEILHIDEDTGQINMKLKPTYDSGKLPYLMLNLEEQGIDPDDPSGTSQAIVASQFRETVEMVYRYLTEKGIPCIRITGGVSAAESERAQRTFKHGNDSEGLRVVCMVTTMGVGLTLNNVETVHMLDETWNPDDWEQITDRAIDTNRNHQVTAFNYRSDDTIERYIYEVAGDKAEVNKYVLDRLRQNFKSKVLA